VSAALALVVAAVAAFAFTRDGDDAVATAVPATMAEPDGAEEWMYLQRANADGSISDVAVEEAIAQSKAAGRASKGSPATDQVWTELGPSNIGGRVRDTAVDPTTKDVVYVASGSGGLWRSTDGGATLTSVWDHYLPQSMGAVAVDSHGVVWAGTGEPDHGGGSAYYGKGIYKSTDHGATWTNMGLEDGDTIGQIVIDPRDDDRVFVAVMGALHDTEPSRGLFMTEDGGATWTRVIVPETTSTGAIDVAIDTSNPDVMLATTWDKIRDEKSRIYGPHSYLYRSTDGGRTWSKVQNAPLPQSETDPALQTPDNLVGRMGVDFSDSDPNRAYLISSTARGNFNGFFTSTDAGATWTAVGPTSGGTLQNISGGFAWWFGGVYVDPQNPLHVFVDGVSLAESLNGGATWTTSQTPHADQHGVAWDPFTPNKVYLGNDGGFYWSLENGRARGLWSKTPRLPTTQFYAMDVSVQDGTRVNAGQRLAQVEGERQQRQRRLVQLRRRRRDDEPDRSHERPEVLRLLPERRLPRLPAGCPQQRVQHDDPGAAKELGRSARVRRRPEVRLRRQREHVPDGHGAGDASAGVAADQPGPDRGHGAPCSRVRHDHRGRDDDSRSEPRLCRHRQRPRVGQPQCDGTGRRGDVDEAREPRLPRPLGHAHHGRSGRPEGRVGELLGLALG
jgi:photosystem II stability/assembly factor-like uncharacterized protein